MTIEDPVATFPVTAILPDSPGYDEARQSFNGMLDRRPAVIVPCASTEEVVTAVRAARVAGLPIAVRGGGHSVAGHGVADGALVVSLAGMRHVIIDPDRRMAHAEGGCQWLDLDTATTAHGLAVPGGTFIDTGIAGLTLGGGLGWLMPIAGLTCDNLVEAEVVTADGSVVIANADTDADLLWALRGGGGNFGVVTRFSYRLTPLRPIIGGRFRYPLAAAPELLARVDSITADRPAAMMPVITARRDPDMGEVCGILFAIVDGEDPAPILARLRDGMDVVLDEVGPMTYGEMQAYSGLLPFGLRHYWKGHFLRELDGELMASLAAEAVADDAVGSSFLMLEGLADAARIEPEGGAAFGQRAAAWNASGLAIWESPDDDERAVGWSRRIATLLEPASLTGGGYVNYSPADESAVRVRSAYGDDRWARLVGVKRRYDPDNVFRFNHNIDPAG